jgi:hypothetical protein
MNTILPNNRAKNLTNKTLFSDSESCQNEYQMFKNLMMSILMFLLSIKGSQKKINQDAAEVMKNCTTDDPFFGFKKICSQNLTKLGNRNQHPLGEYDFKIDLFQYMTTMARFDHIDIKSNQNIILASLPHESIV